MSDFMDALVRALRDHQQAIDTLTARITQLERDADPRTAALTVGTVVRVDDKALAWHDDVGTVVRVPGPGDAPDTYEVALPGGVVTIHRAHLALVDDTLAECGECHGAGSIPLFSGVAECDACGGSGVVRP